MEISECGRKTMGKEYGSMDRKIQGGGFLAFEGFQGFRKTVDKLQ